MRLSTRLALALVLAGGLVLGAAGAAQDEPTPPSWLDLMPSTAWRDQARGWSTIGLAKLDPNDPKRLAFEPGTGILCNGPVGKVPNIVTVETFGDVEVHFDFFLPKGSNSGVKFQEVYEIQLFDSFGVKQPKGIDLGGVYPRSEAKPKYHYLDDGHAPLANAARPPGEWQTLDAIFLAPRFDSAGTKIADARISATINGVPVQHNVRVATPTGAAHKNKEKPTGRLLLQGDHGPVAYRNVRARVAPPEKVAAMINP